MQTVVQPFPRRSTVSEETGGLRISIPPKRSWVLLFFAVWLCFWTFAGIQAGRDLLKHFSLFMVVWMIGWAFGELWASYAILYALGGREIIAANSEGLSRRKEIFGLGLAKTYLSNGMRDLRFQPEVGAGKRRRASRIAFDYGAKTISFAEDVEEAEAAELISLIRVRCNIEQTQTPRESGIKFWQQQ